MPITGTLAMVASAAMAGVPLLNGFLSKEMFFAETVFISSLPWVEWGLPVAATLAGVFAVVYALRFGYGGFAGPLSTDLPREPHEPVRWMRAPIELLVLACLVVGIVPARSVGPALAAAARPVVGGTLPEYSLAVWHGFNAPFIMSLVAMAGGVALYVFLRRQDLQDRIMRSLLTRRLDGKRAFEAVLALSLWLARRVVRLLGTRRLQPQIFWIAMVAVLATIAALSDGGLVWGDRARVPATPGFVVLWAIGALCAVGAAWQAKFHRLAALCMLAVTGLLTCLTFVWFSAPDLALTQLVVEVVTTVLFLLGLRWMPKRLPSDEAPPTLRVRVRRGRDFLLAIVSGAGLAALSYALLTRPAPQSISPFFLAHAVPGGGGANVVNVMLVDFRSFDTMGEITVLGAVALTVFALLRRFRPPRESIEPPRQQRIHRATDLVNPRAETDATLGYMMVPAVLARLLLALAVLVAAHLFLRVHDAPGGGFVAVLVEAIALIMKNQVAGARWVEAHLLLNPARWIATGLVLVAATGAGAIVVGFPFLTTHVAHADVPLLGTLHVPSALFFDLGVFATVVGATLMILIALAHQSVRSRRGAQVVADAIAAGAGANAVSANVAANAIATGAAAAGDAAAVTAGMPGRPVR
jgi:multicomponent K+:H+ antiporter subunit A